MMRAATADDAAAVAELQRAWDTAWFGAPEHSVDEVRETFDQALALGGQAQVVVADDRVVAAAWHWEQDAWLAADQQAEVRQPYAQLLAWFAQRPALRLEALDRDDALRAALAEQGWRHTHSSFDLIRLVEPAWDVPEPSVPPGVRLVACTPDLAAAVHELIYVHAGWTEVPGHPDRDLDGWRAVFLDEDTATENGQPLLAWRGDRLIGVAITRAFDDGTHWISQLAVAKDERRHGIGRALLLAGLRRGVDSRARTLGLNVQAPNRSALALYLDVGLRIDREWLAYQPPAPST